MRILGLRDAQIIDITHTIAIIEHPSIPNAMVCPVQVSAIFSANVNGKLVTFYQQQMVKWDFKHGRFVTGSLVLCTHMKKKSEPCRLVSAP